MPYLIDGNNLLGSWGGVRRGDRRGDVVRRVAAFCRARGARATIVFDGRPLRSDWDAQELGPISIRFPPEGLDADTLIRRIVDQARNPSELVVVTSDKALYSYCRTRGTDVVRAHEWNALERRFASGPSASGPAEKPAIETDVEGWLRAFATGSGPRRPSDDEKRRSSRTRVKRR